MTLLDRMLERGWEMPVDPIIAARIERHMRRIKPDPLFQRRLRSEVVNLHVATREGLVEATQPVRLPRRGLSTLGRGMLFASLLTAVSVTAVGAAAQESLPGDLLYGVKLELESIRMELAPADVRQRLAALALDERLDEVEALAAAGRWGEMDDAVAAVERAQATLAALSSSPDGGTRTDGVAMPEHIDRLASLISTAPDAEKRGLLRALAASGGSSSDVHSNRDHQTSNRGQRKGQQVVPVAPSASPEATTPPSATASPTPTQPPAATPTPEPEDPQAQPTPTGSGSQGGGGGQGGQKGGKTGNGQLKGNSSGS